MSTRAASILQRGLMFATRLVAAPECATVSRAWVPAARLVSRHMPAPARVGALYHSSAASLSMADAVQRELEHEKEQVADGESALNAPHAGWTISTDAGSTIMKLSKQAGGELVEVIVNTVEQEDDAFMGGEEEEDQNEPEYSITFRVDCTKGDQTLRYTCSYVENDQAPPGIEHVAVVPKGGISVEEQMSKYEGPAFMELDEGLQGAFAEHIAGHGVDADLGQYLCRLVYDKEQADYVSWLEKVQKWNKA
jgi:Mitochondrial glycoprotein